MPIMKSYRSEYPTRFALPNAMITAVLDDALDIE